MKDLVFQPAAALARLLRARKLSATEVARAFIAQVERVNPKVNAIVTFLPELALKQAKALDRRKPEPGKPLWGLPIAYKDVVPTKGIRTTYGSPVYRDHVPAEDHLVVERLAAAGVVTLGKTNTPEFAAGSQTFNAVFGPTRNPYDTSRTCGGSSGGAAVAVACGMLPFADGSDLGASLRWGALAIVAKTDLLFGMSRILGVFVEDSFSDTGVFRNVAEAERWLDAHLASR